MASNVFSAGLINLPRGVLTADLNLFQYDLVLSMLLSVFNEACTALVPSTALSNPLIVLNIPGILATFFAVVATNAPPPVPPVTPVKAAAASSSSNTSDIIPAVYADDIAVLLKNPNKPPFVD